MVRVYFYKTRDDAHLPEYTDAGFELKTPKTFLAGNGFDHLDIGLDVEIQDGYYGLITNKVDRDLDVVRDYGQEYTHKNDFVVIQEFVPSGTRVHLKVHTFRQCPINTYCVNPSNGQSVELQDVPIKIVDQVVAVLQIKKIRKNYVKRMVNLDEWYPNFRTLPFSS